MEKAWLSLFRFVEFFMGLSYIDADKVHITLEKIKVDHRLPGGQIDIKINKKNQITIRGAVTRIGEMILNSECLNFEIPT